jgi:hypothetical protein
MSPSNSSAAFGYYLDVLAARTGPAVRCAPCMSVADAIYPAREVSSPPVGDMSLVLPARRRAGGRRLRREGSGTSAVRPAAAGKLAVWA